MNGGAANVIMDNLIAQGKAVPMVVVATLGYGVNNGPAGAMAAENITGYTRSLLTEVMPAVERNYHVSRTRDDRAIAGLSMGGAEGVYTALNNLDKFAWIGSFSGAFVMWPRLVEPPSTRRSDPGFVPLCRCAPGRSRSAGCTGARGETSLEETVRSRPRRHRGPARRRTK
jgi:enterochelin esterase-like enzyme